MVAAQQAHVAFQLEDALLAVGDGRAFGCGSEALREGDRAGVVADRDQPGTAAGQFADLVLDDRQLGPKLGLVEADRPVADCP